MYRVLLVDDNFYDLQGVSEYIDWEAQGCVLIDTARNGMEGYEKACIMKPDIIITDVSMPYLNGVEMVEKIRSVFDDIQVIYMSCHSDFEFLKAALEQQAVSYVLKPLELAELTKCIAAAGQRLEVMREKQLTERKLREVIKKNNEFMTEKYFFYLLSYEEDEDSFEEMQVDICECFEIDMDTQSSYILVTLVMFPKSSKENIIYQKYLLTEVARKILGITESDCIVGIDDEMLVLMLNGEQHDKDDAHKIACEMQSKAAEQFAGYKVMVFVGSSAVSLWKLHSEFQYQQSVINLGYFDLATSVLVINASITEHMNITSIEIKQINQLMYRVLTEEEIDIDEVVNRIYSDNVLRTVSATKMTTFQILFSISKLLEERGYSFASIFGLDPIIWDKFYRFETILNIRQWIKNIIISSRECLFREDKTPYGRIVSNIEERILKQYMSAQVIDDSVNALGISLGHANKVFKQCKGVTIFKYLTNIRIEESKRMLKSSDMKIGEIAEKVGFPNVSYFTTFFKKNTSLTPNEYRQHHRREKMNDEDL